MTHDRLDMHHIVSNTFIHSQELRLCEMSPLQLPNGKYLTQGMDILYRSSVLVAAGSDVGKGLSLVRDIRSFCQLRRHMAPTKSIESATEDVPKLRDV